MHNDQEVIVNVDGNESRLNLVEQDETTVSVSSIFYCNHRLP